MLPPASRHRRLRLWLLRHHGCGGDEQASHRRSILERMPHDVGLEILALLHLSLGGSATANGGFGARLCENA
jgi:hypothetical protein